jgi:hypothetical protein
LNILIIGNGFDLAHGLKTTYNDFLAWAYKNDKMGIYNGFDLFSHWQKELYFRSQPGAINFDSISYPKFFSSLFKEFDGWIDLENNLAKFIESAANSQIHIDVAFKSIFNKFLISELNRYIADVVNKTEVTAQLPIKNVDKVLSFNYSNTFERLYTPNYKEYGLIPVEGTEICYVNGKASTSSARPSIVFGCDYYDFNRKHLTEYNKTFQRTALHTDGYYRSWLNECVEDYNHLQIVGHSLGKTDWEIIRPFVTSEKIVTSVYYHSESSMKELIHNMMGMVGQEFMIKKSIRFAPLSVLIMGASQTFEIVV